MRLGVCGSLSATSSASAITVKIPTESNEPMSDNGDKFVSQPRCAAHAVAAGAVSARSPPKNPMRKAKSSVNPRSSLHLMITSLVQSF